MKEPKIYSTQLHTGLGVLEESKSLLRLWEPGMKAPALCQKALKSGSFSKMSARRVRNLVIECFAPRFLRDGGEPAHYLQRLSPFLSTREFEQLLFLYTCRANLILADFVVEVYWERFGAGQQELTNLEARDFVVCAIRERRTAKAWSPGTIRRQAGYLTGACSDFGLLEPGRKTRRKILTYRLESRVAAVLAYDLHFHGNGDNAFMANPDWRLFGMDQTDIVEEMKKLSLKNWLIMQKAGTLTRITWKCKNLEELVDVLAQG